jgi:AcrR family transcriptional regulator
VESSQRRRILDGIVEVVAEQGYPDTRVVDVIERAGVSRKTFYELFADKEECFLDAYDLAVRRLYQGTEVAYESAARASWAERMRVAFAGFLAMLAEQPELAKFCVVDVLAAGPKALARRDAALRQFTGFIDAGRAETGRELPGITALSLAGGINELLYSEILHGASAQLPMRLPEIIFWVTQPFLGTERAEAERRRAREQLGGLRPQPGRDRQGKGRDGSRGRK